MAPINFSKFAIDSTISLPRTSHEWKVTLHSIKTQYLLRKYKQCAKRASRLLDLSNGSLHPVYRTFLQFYLAISYEMQGRAAHHYASSKIPLLQQALDNFITCSMSLPPLLPIPDRSPQSESASSSQRDSSLTSEDTVDGYAAEVVAGSISKIIELSMEMPFLKEDDPFVSLETIDERVVTCSFELPQNSSRQLKLMPSPLRIRKPSDDDDDIVPCQGNMERTGSPFLTRRKSGVRLSLPLKIIASHDTNGQNTVKAGKVENPPNHLQQTGTISTTKRKTANQDNLPLTPRRANAARRYNDVIVSFGEQLHSNIVTISSLMADVTDLQHIHRTTKCSRSMSFWSFRPLEARPGSDQSNDSSSQSSRPVQSSINSFSFAIPGALLDETKQQRIARLRSECWSSVGLRNVRRGWKGGEYYERLCAGVLEDIECA